MKKLLVIIFCFASACSRTFAGIGNEVTKAYADSKGRLHIITADGSDHTIRPKQWQSGGSFGTAQIAPDGKTVGWTVEEMLTPLEGATNYSYTVARELDIWRDGHVIRRFSPNSLDLQNWMFLKGGSEVAFHIAPPHGQEFYDCTLFEVNTGKELAHWALDRKDYVVPDWATQLLVDDPLPGPNEISNWFPDSPKSAKRVTQPHQK
jgi:hypothetical protein